ncbi:MAG: thermonuclease family protein [Myxococcota bacterium]
MFAGARVVFAIALSVAVGSGCERGVIAEDTSLSAPGVSRDRAAKKPEGQPRTSHGDSVAREGIILGEYPGSSVWVIDGDTIRVDDLRDAVRIIAIDTEEVPKRRERASIERDFKGHLRRARGDSPRPRKPGTPMGDDAKAFAAEFFADVESVRLERDEPKRQRGHFGRPLAYVFARKDGRWTHYNVEAVRAGMSPYFTKYGYSQRFHNQFARAESEAQAAKRGIWDPGLDHYDDYPERKSWWDARADFIRTSEHRGAGQDNYLLLDHSDAAARLEALVGEEAVVLGTVGRIQFFKGLVRVFLEGANKFDFPLIFRSRAVFAQSGLGRFTKEPVLVRGTVERYKKGKVDTLQIVVTDPRQVSLPKLPPSRDETTPAVDR